MNEKRDPTTSQETVEIALKNPPLAAFVAWLWPGAGHIYQGRHGKGVLFMACILSTYFFGLVLGGGHVVYASWEKENRRWAYLSQVGVGLPALPALVQAQRAKNGKAPLLGGIMAPPRDENELNQWHKDYPTLFEIGTLYTMVAGLLNILVIYDAYAGPVSAASDDREETGKPPPEE